LVELPWFFDDPTMFGECCLIGVAMITALAENRATPDKAIGTATGREG
jgi:hypothetical protein